MDTKSTKRLLAVGVPIALLLLGGAAGAESKEASGARGGSEAQESDNSLRQKQELALEAEVGELSEVAPQLKEAQDSINEAEARTGELEKQSNIANGHKDSERARETIPQPGGTREEQVEKSRKEEKTRAEELKRAEGKLNVAVDKLSTDKKQQMEERIEQLELAEEAGEIQVPPASGGGGLGVDQELEIAREEIVARPVEEIPYKRYIQIYKAAAKRYGFAEDWYVLAAVGKVESNHGENMGPSSAGAMGPMQFLPSTWKQFGVDGNKDGVANIMDPEDAIPAAASYLKYGGAPEDFYAALYVYNRAGWYVREVLGIAEGYRRLEKNEEVEPYV